MIRSLRKWAADKQRAHAAKRFSDGQTFARSVLAAATTAAQRRDMMAGLENHTDSARLFNEYDDFDRGIDHVLREVEAA